MTKVPPIPKEQQSFRGERPDVQGSAEDRRDAKTGLQSPDQGDGDVNLENQGRQGNIRQNVDAVRAKNQDR